MTFSIVGDTAAISGKLEIIKAIQKVIQIHVTNEEICEKGCGVLSYMIATRNRFIKMWLLIHSFFTTADIQVATGQIGTIDLVMKIMHEHIDNRALCQHGCDALKKITFNGRQANLKSTQKVKCVHIL